MRNRIQHLRRDEQGMSLVFFGAGFIAFVAAATLAIDVGMFMNARTQAQNSADSGALSGVTALVYNSFTDRSSTGPAVQSAMNAAKANKVIGFTPTVTPADVTFPLSPTGANNRVQVDVHRAGSNAVQTLIGSLFGVNTVDINASATAEASPANAMTCVKPFMIPDKWREVGTPPWDTGDTFDMYDNHNNLLPAGSRDVYVPARDCLTCADNPDYTGYTTSNDTGMRLTLRAGTGTNINPSFYFSWKMPDDIGGNFYRDNIANCNQSLMHWYDLIIQEPGDKSGPTIQGIQDLIAKDPNARWDTSCNCVKGSAFPISPRVFPIPLYDPKYYADGKANGRDADFRIANFLGFFAEPPIGNSIPGRVTQIVGVVDDGAGPAPAAMYPRSIRLVK
jgi:Flp pilus assembly protein TadG